MSTRFKYRDELIDFFMNHPGESFTRSELMEALGRKHTTVWGNIQQINRMDDFEYTVKSEKVPPKVKRFGPRCVVFYLERKENVKKNE